MLNLMFMVATLILLSLASVRRDSMALLTMILAVGFTRVFYAGLVTLTTETGATILTRFTFPLLTTLATVAAMEWRKDLRFSVVDVLLLLGSGLAVPVNPLVDDSISWMIPVPPLAAAVAYLVSKKLVKGGLTVEVGGSRLPLAVVPLHRLGEVDGVVVGVVGMDVRDTLRESLDPKKRAIMIKTIMNLARKYGKPVYVLKRPNFPLALIIGFIIAISATAVVLMVLSEALPTLPYSV